MNVRPFTEEDIEQVIQLFRSNYGDDYPMPEFYDREWIRRGIYSDHIIWMVIEDEGKIVASGAAILDYGDYNDQIAEIGRLVVDPTTGGKGLGRQMIDVLVDASDDRVEFVFGEARTTHPKTQKIFDRAELVPLGFLPMHYKVAWRESWVLSGQLYGNGRRLRRPGAAQLIPQAVPIAELALRNLKLEETVTPRPDARAYPLDEHLAIEPLSGSSLLRLLKIEHGRLTDPEVFGSLHVDMGMTAIQARKSAYLVAGDGDHTVGAVGYKINEANANARIIELIAHDDSVKGTLLRRAVEDVEQHYAAESIDVDVSAYSPRVQRTLLDLGFLPVAFIPGMVFHHTSRWDVVRMTKLNVPWDPRELVFTDSGQAMYNVVAPAFERADAKRARRQLAFGAQVLAGLTQTQVSFLEQVGEELSPAPGTVLESGSLYIVLAGSVKEGGRTLARGESTGAATLLGRASADSAAPVVAGDGARLLCLKPEGLAALSERHPRLGVSLYRNLAAEAWKTTASAGEAAAV